MSGVFVLHLVRIDLWSFKTTKVRVPYYAVLKSKDSVRTSSISLDFVVSEAEFASQCLSKWFILVVAPYTDETGAFSLFNNNLNFDTIQ